MKKIVLILISIPLLGLVVLSIITNYPPSIQPTPISSKKIIDEPGINQDYFGKPSIPKPLKISIPEHPYLAPGAISTIHSGAWNSDVHYPSGPLGKNLQMVTRKGPTLIGGMCSTTVFGQEDVLITFCGSLAGFEFQMLEPKTLKFLARYRLPQRPSTYEGLVKMNFDIIMSDTSGGAYFYLDHEGYIVFADSKQQLQRVGHRKKSNGEWEFYLDKTWDLSKHVPVDCFSAFNLFPTKESCDPITAVTPDHQGLIWWVTRHGRIGTLDTKTNRIEYIYLENEEIQNSFAADKNAIYVLSDHAIYALNTDEEGKPKIIWHEEYDRGNFRKTGLATQGSGTTPTLFSKHYLTYADNSDGKVHLVVLNRSPDYQGNRLICRVPLFKENYSATEISMIAYNQTIVIENTYGYWNALQQTEWNNVVGGISRIDVRDDESGCDVIWTSSEVSPSGVGKLSVGNGLLYYYTFTPQSTGENAWYITALDSASGATVFKKRTGAGSNFDVNWGPLTIGPDGTLYASARGGLISLWDDEKPQ